MFRVLAHDGLLCIRVPDWTRLDVSPLSESTQRAIDRFLECHYGNRSDPRIGSRLDKLIGEASFTVLNTTSSIERNDASKMFSNLADRLTLAGYTDDAQHLHALSLNPNATFMQTWSEVIARKKNG